MPIYKLTDETDETYGGCQWGEGVTHTADGQGELCTEHWIHAYPDPLLAVMMNPIHGGYDLGSAHLWECEGAVGTDDGTKLGCTTLTTVKRMELPVVTTEQRVCFGILCAREVYRGAAFLRWSDAWLAGQDRSKKAAQEAAWAAATLAVEAAAAWAAAWADAGAAAKEAAWAAWGARALEPIDLVALAHRAARNCDRA